jgi:hypothetical protein
MLSLELFAQKFRVTQVSVGSNCITPNIQREKYFIEASTFYENLGVSFQVNFYRSSGGKLTAILSKLSWDRSFTR